MTTDKFAAERRRNKAMNDWIRQGISAPNMPLEVPGPDEPDEPDAAPGTPRTPAGPPSADAGAGTGGRRTGPEPSMNELLRDDMRFELLGRRHR